MAEVWHRWGGVLTVWIVVLPVAACVAGFVARRRRRAGRSARTAWATAVVDVAIVVATVPWVWMILTPTAQPGAVEPFPGAGLAGMLSAGTATAVVQVGANLVFLAPAGALVPLRRRVGATAVGVGAVAFSGALEALQYLLDLGRVTSVDDVLLNTAGAVGGALLTRRWWLRRGRQELATASR